MGSVLRRVEQDQTETPTIWQSRTMKNIANRASELLPADEQRSRRESVLERVEAARTLRFERERGCFSRII